MIKITLILFQVLLLITVSPLLSGVIRKIKNTLRMRQGAGIFQPYFNFFKLLSKEEVVSENTSFIFTCTPFIVFGSVTTALFIIPTIASNISFNIMGDVLAVIFLLALGRFFIALAAIDAGSAFGGMGSSREMFIASFTEPVALLALFTVSVTNGSTGMDAISASHPVHLSTVIAGAALFIVMIAETSRLPVDNQETHLELTMVHEAMVLEYSGRSLALIELASHVKQIIFYALIANILIPPGAIAGLGLFEVLTRTTVFALKIFCIGAIAGIVEVSTAKMRLFRVIDFLAFGFVLSFISMIAAVAGF
ncbi:MAG: NADH-quinone oxidoreductase subunit H [Elusimicrobia bacterium]|nr:NADH-quinone oxidoreductase subunit H [Candidatus Liberimonas magnetica]